MLLICPWSRGLEKSNMESCLSAVVSILLVSGVSAWVIGNVPRGPQMFPCITYFERNLRVDCEFPPTDKTPGPYCEFKQDSRLAGSTRPGAQPLLDLKRRANVSLVNPSLCRLVYARLPGTSDEKAYTYTCRVIQGDVALENSMALHPRNVPVCSAKTIQNTAGFLLIAMSLPVILGFLTA